MSGGDGGVGGLKEEGWKGKMRQSFLRMGMNIT